MARHEDGDGKVQGFVKIGMTSQGEVLPPRPERGLRGLVTSIGTVQFKIRSY